MWKNYLKPVRICFRSRTILLNPTDYHCSNSVFFKKHPKKGFYISSLKTRKWNGSHYIKKKDSSRLIHRVLFSFYVKDISLHIQKIMTFMWDLMSFFSTFTYKIQSTKRINAIILWYKLKILDNIVNPFSKHVRCINNHLGWSNSKTDVVDARQPVKGKIWDTEKIKLNNCHRCWK